jgi:hypothetical protein
LLVSRGRAFLTRVRQATAYRQKGGQYGKENRQSP